uniref:Uncharacterized protein n=1 Tax=Glossina austeni TaxID=7395 RepID=A0A1A9VGM0_GLOAU
MNHKVWRKPLHKRKVWKQMPLFSKLIYYMQPFVENLLDTWLQPLPFPTILKLMHSCILMVFIFLPILYPILIMIIYYGILQYLIESLSCHFSHFDIRYTSNVDLIHYIDYVFNYRMANEKHALFVHLYIERWRYVAAALASFVDYMRLILCLMMG